MHGNVMPDELKIEGDKRFFTAALDRADLVVHGRHSAGGAAECAEAAPPDPHPQGRGHAPSIRPIR